MTTNQLMFFIFSAIIVIFSLLTVTTRRILRAATFLLFVLVSTAGLYFMLRFNFLAAIQLTLYAGGIVVLIIFSILLTSQLAEKLESVTGIRHSAWLYPDVYYNPYISGSKAPEEEAQQESCSGDP